MRRIHWKEIVQQFCSEAKKTPEEKKQEKQEKEKKKVIRLEQEDNEEPLGRV